MGTETQPVPDSLNQPQAPQSGSGRKWGLVALVTLLVVLGIAAGYYAYVNNWGQPQEPADNQQQNNQNDTNQQAAQSGMVAWTAPQTVADLGLINPVAVGDQEVRTVKVGTIAKGQYQGYDLLVIAAPCEGPCFYLPFVRGVKQGDKFVALGRYSTVYDLADKRYFQKQFEVDSSIVIEDLEYPDSLAVLDGRATLKFEKNAGDWFEASKYVKLFVHEKFGQAYTDPSGSESSQHGIYFAAPDSTIRTYSLVADLQPKITWNDGSITTTEYFSHSTRIGCGSSNYAAVVSGLRIGTDIVEAGRNDKMEKIYVYKDSNNQFLLDMYERAKFSPSTGAEVNYQVFLSDRPVWFWVDPFGRMIRFENSRYQPIAECGKPVIYLYPETEMPVRVEVDPIGGMSVSDPAYNGGWEVLARPDGRLTETASGRDYPYLFWEGRGGIYSQPKTGFVVRQAEVRELLTDKLGQFNLNQNEIADFLEFWEPRMQDSPYYFITFLGTESMNQLAPLNITPKPDTVIRVLMDFTPLAEPIAVEGFKITAPERQGFTVIEWGGVIR